MSVRDLLTRRVHVGISSILVTLSTTVSVAVVSGALTVLEGWSPVGAFEIGLLAVAAAFLACAYYLIVSSTRKGDLSVVREDRAPYKSKGPRGAR